MEKVLVIGAASQLGFYLCEILLSQGYYVIGTGRDLSKIKSKVIKTYLDINDRYLVYKLIEEYKPDAVINCAAIVSVSDSWNRPADYLQNNSLSIIHQLDAIRKIVPNCKYFNTSSIEEFNVDNIYGLSKLVGSKILGLYREKYRLNLSTGFCSNLVSPLSKEDYILPKLTKSLLNIRKKIDLNESFDLVPVGNLSATRSFIHVYDVASCIVEFIKEDKSLELPIVGDEYISIWGLLEKIKNKLLISPEIQVSEVKLELWRHDNQAKISNKDTKNILNWQPKYSLDYMIDEMIGFYKSKSDQNER